jgi:hypothetical protein
LSTFELLTMRLLKGVSVKRKGADCAKSMICEAVGKRKWIVKLDDGTHEELTSSQLITLPKDADKAIAEDTTIIEVRFHQNDGDALPIHVF